MLNSTRLMQLIRLTRMCLVTNLLYGSLPYPLSREKPSGPPDNVSRNERIYQETYTITPRDETGGYYDNAPSESQYKRTGKHLKNHTLDRHY